MVDALRRDFASALRLLRQTPMVSAVAMLSLALGIGANVAIFSLVNALLLKTLPTHAPEQLALLSEPSAPGRAQRTSFTNPQWEYLRDHHDTFSGMFAQSGTRFDLNAGGEARPISGMFVSGRFFDVLGVTPAVGRLLTEEDDRRGGGTEGPVAVLSYGFWQREFAGDRAAVGRAIQLDGHAYTIVGVTPPAFYGIEVGRTFDVAVPLATEAIIRGAESGLDQRSMWWLRVMGRLAPGQTPDEAQARLRALQPALREATMPEQYRPEDRARYFAEPLTLAPGGNGLSSLRARYSQPLYVLLAIVALVLLIACANMANLLLAQSAARQRELAIRMSLGATRWQLARQLLLESLLLSGLGAAGGMVLAHWSSRALVALLSTRTSLVTLDLALDARVLGFTIVVAVVTGLLFGVAPAMRATRVAPATALRDRGRGVIAGGRRFNAGQALVALQVAVSFVLILGAGLFVRTLVDLTAQEMGFNAGRVLIANLDTRRTGETETTRPALFARLRDAVAAAPGVEAAAVSVITPISNAIWNTVVTVPGLDAPERDRESHFNRVTPDFFRVMGTPILAGRDFSAADRAGAPSVALVNEAFARKFFPGQSPLGRTFEVGDGRRGVTSYTIIGLTGDAKYASLREPAPPTVYTAWAQTPTAMAHARVSLRVQGDPNAFRATTLAALQAVDKNVVVDFKAFEQDISAAVQQERLVASLSAVFGALALLLAVIGLYGVVSYSVARRRNEIGIRIALGAPPGRVMRLVLGNVAILTGSGLALGIALAFGAAQFVNSLLFGLVADDRVMLLAAAVTLSAAAATAGLVPARRAARVDPTVALREP